MDTSITPDPKYQTKNFYIHLTVTVSLVLPVAIIIAIINAVEPGSEAPPIIWMILGISLAIVWILVYPLVSLWIRNLSYVVQEDQVTIYKGILTKTQQNIPFRAVTDFVLERSLYDRFLGIGSVKIQTAGQSQNPSGYEGTLSGLLEYERWHSELRDRMKAMHHPAGPTTTGEELSEGEVFAAMLAELQAIRKAVEGS